MNVRSIPAGSATPSGRINSDFVKQAVACLGLQKERERDDASFWVCLYLEEHIRGIDNRREGNMSIKKEATAIVAAVAALVAAMDAAGPETVAMMGIVHGKNISPDLGGGAVKAAEKFEINFQDCRDCLQAVECAADRVAKELPSQERADHMSNLVGRLGDIWLNTTRKKPTRNKNQTNGENPTGFQEFMTLVKQSLPKGEQHKNFPGVDQYTYGMEAAIRTVTSKR